MAEKYRSLPELSAQEVNRFWSKVRMMPSGCWEWQKSLATSGYGQFHVTLHDGSAKQRNCPAHRIAYSIYYAVREIEFEVCHICDNLPCVNPFHLFLGTHTDNMRDMVNKRRNNQPKGKTHYKTRFSAAEVLEMRERFAQGVSISKIAKKNSTNYLHIWQIIHRRSWKHI